VVLITVLLVGWQIDRLLKADLQHFYLDWGAAPETALSLSIFPVSMKFIFPAWGYSASSSLMVQGWELGLFVKGSHHRAGLHPGSK